MLVLAFAEATIWGIAAAVSALVGVGLSIAAYRSKREQDTFKANEEQHKQLLDCRAEAERLSAELHKFRMKYGDETPQ
jgi:hypothetical protein